MKKSFTHYDGYLITFQNLNQIEEQFSKLQKPFFHTIWYPTVQYTPFFEVDPTHLFFICAHWGNRLTDNKYRSLYNKLDSRDYMEFYGGGPRTNKRLKHYKGKIPFDGFSLIDKLQKSGVCLILHSDKHLYNEIPTGRVFEAAAASAVIISDHNQFVIDNFGDSVLYVDQTKSAGEMFQQIDQHMKWIQENREKALEMVKRAHDIFEEKFQMEDQILRIEDFHNMISNHKAL